MHPTYVALHEVTLQTGAWLYGVHKTCTETAAISHGTMQQVCWKAENSDVAAIVMRLGLVSRLGRWKNVHIKVPCVIFGQTLEGANTPLSGISLVTRRGGATTSYSTPSPPIPSLIQFTRTSPPGPPLLHPAHPHLI